MAYLKETESLDVVVISEGAFFMIILDERISRPICCGRYLFTGVILIGILGA
tara:strand:- start:361 stop:516 length:156 start_codon:yes stop_codon:yes gene_type:complete